MTDFTFDDNTKGVLNKKNTNNKPPKKGIKAEEKKKNRVQCYLTDSEYESLNQMLDGRPASVYFRKLLLRDLKENPPNS